MNRIVLRGLCITMIAVLGAACGGDDTTTVPDAAGNDSGTPDATADGGADADATVPDGGDAQAPALAVAPTTTTTIVSGAPIPLTATLTGSSSTIAWTLDGPGSLSATTGPTVSYVPPSTGPIGVAAVTATAGALTATSLIDVAVPPRHGVVAYLWANSPFNPSYNPPASFSYNAGGGAITITRSSAGAYAVTFAGLDMNGGDVQVTPVGQGSRCNVTSWTSNPTIVNVACFDSSFVAQDAGFMLALTSPTPATHVTPIAWAWANDATSSSYTPPAAYSYNAGGGAITATRQGLGLYNVSFANLALPPTGGHFQVTPTNGDRFCGVISWGLNDVTVRCATPNGLTDSKFVISVYEKDRFTKTGVAAYAWADQSGAASYAPAAKYAFNASGKPITATRTAAGTYAMSFAGLELARGTVKVSAYGSAKQCNVEGWGGTKVDVRCYDAAGTLTDSQYVVEVILDSHPIDASIAAYAWADQEATASYTPSGVYSYNATGSIAAARTAVGKYTMTFAGVPAGTGTVSVTAYQSAQHCTIADWNGTTVSVGCYDKTGSPADTRYTIAVVNKGTPSAAAVAGYVIANDPTTASYTPKAATAYSSTGGAITATRTSAGVYAMAFTGLNLASGDVQATTVDSSKNCVVWGWGGVNVDVHCFDTAGAPADSAYALSAITNDAVSQANVVAYAAADQPTVASYTTGASVSYNASGKAITATRSAVGVYALKVANLDLATANVKVTTAGSSSSCTLKGAAGDTVNVTCFDASGAAVDAIYAVVVTQ